METSYFVKAHKQQIELAAACHMMGGGLLMFKNFIIFIDNV